MTPPNSTLLKVGKFYLSKKGNLRAIYCARLVDEPARIYRRATEELESMLNLPEPRPLKEPSLSSLSVNA